MRRASPVRSAKLACAGALVVALVLPGAASAHAFNVKPDLPIPTWLFAWGAAIVLVVSFVALAALWRKPRLENARERELWRYPSVLEPLLGALGVAIFAIVVYSGFAGEQGDYLNSLIVQFVYVMFWVGVPITSIALGDYFRALNPWRAAARAAVWIDRRAGTPFSRFQPMDYPKWLGRWPAVIGVLLFAWLELAYANRTDPTKLAALALIYAAVQLGGMRLYGIETWSSRADPFAVYFNLFSRLSPLDWWRDRLLLRSPLAAIAELEPAPGTIALLAAMIGSTSFDGLSFGSLWLGHIAPHLQSFFANIGAGPEVAGELSGTLGLLFCWLFVVAIYRLGIAGMRTVEARYSERELAQRFVHTLVPIAAAYVVAHYFSYLVFNGQSIAYLISDPLGNGSNIFGTKNAQINYSVLSANAIWYVQVAALILGHACGLALAHDKALVTYRRLQAATRSQYWMLAVMVSFTCLGLWLISNAQ